MSVLGDTKRVINICVLQYSLVLAFYFFIYMQSVNHLVSATTIAKRSTVKKLRPKIRRLSGGCQLLSRALHFTVFTVPKQTHMQQFTKHKVCIRLWFFFTVSKYFIRLSSLSKLVNKLLDKMVPHWDL